MIDMDDEIAGAEIGELGQERFGLALPRDRPGQPVAEDVLFGDDQEAVGIVALFQAQDGAAQRIARPGHEFGEVVDRHLLLQAVFAEQMADPFDGTLAEGSQQDAFAGLLLGADRLGRGVINIDVRD